MRKLITSVLFAVLFSSAVYSQEKTYFDANWEVTNKDKMEYYRETTKQGTLTLIKDFYKNGTLQMEGLASDLTPGSEVFEGKVTWYFPSGKPSSIVEYKKGAITGSSQSYDESGRLIEDIKYTEDGNFNGKMYSYKNEEYGAEYNSMTEYKDSHTSYNIIYDNSEKGIRVETFYKDGVENLTKYYDEKAKLIGTKTTDFNYVSKGISVEYFYNPMSVAKIEKLEKDGTVNESKLFYRNGKLLQETKLSKKDGTKITYDETGKKIGTLTYKLNEDYKTLEPYEGDDYAFNYGSTTVMSVNTYKAGEQVSVKLFDEKGVLQKESFYKDSYENKTNYYNPNGTLKSTLVYQDGLPYDGAMYEEYSESLYKDGVMLQNKILFENGKTRLLKKINATKTNYDAKIYDEEGNILYSYVSLVNPENGFTAEITQYDKEKIINKAKVKDDALASGKLKLKSYDSLTEIERSGDWLYTRKLSETGKLISELKEAVNTEDDYYQPSTYVTEEMLLNYY